MAYDKVLIKYLEKDELFPRLKQTVADIYNQLHQMKQLIEMKKEGERENDLRQLAKEPIKQAELNREIKNEDSFYKYAAFGGMIEK